MGALSYRASDVTDTPRACYPGPCPCVFMAAVGRSPGSGSRSRRCCGRRVWAPRTAAAVEVARLLMIATAATPVTTASAGHPGSATGTTRVRPIGPSASSGLVPSARPIGTAPRTGPCAMARRASLAATTPSAKRRSGPVRGNTVSAVAVSPSRLPTRRTQARAALLPPGRRVRVAPTPIAGCWPDPRAPPRSVPVCPAPRRSRAAPACAISRRRGRTARRSSADAHPAIT